MPIWVESSAMYKKKEIVSNPRQLTIASNPRQLTIAGKGETRVVLGCGKYMKTFHEKGKEVVGPNRFCGHQGSDGEGVEGVIELFIKQMVEYEDPKPLAMDDNIVEDCIESQAMLRV
ncbi:hypothetical protein H5410_057042 [Solanum commersonii]|uniref:Uncharacterized protein n=1 Tax=Solanum commersonii TaxID=4109 RepID=A0A9J5WNZ8_SOLCO|nr:hypothetical protein H5410_057042 [Solanum commersonii]